MIQHGKHDVSHKVPTVPAKTSNSTNPQPCLFQKSFVVCLTFTYHFDTVETSTHLLGSGARHSVEVMVDPQGRLELLDTRAWGKRAAFSGQEQDWPRWCLAFGSFAGLLSQNLQTLMERAAEMDNGPARVSTWSVVGADLARTLFAVLVALCNQGRALSDTLGAQLGGG